MPPNLTQPIALRINQVPLSRHEVRIPMDIARRVQPRNNLVQESLDLVVCAARSEFRDPDGAARGDGARGVDVGFEVGDVGC